MRVLGLHAPRSCHALAAAGALVGARLRQPRMLLRAAEAQGDTVQRRGRSEKTAAAGRDSGAPGTQADVAAATRSGTVAVAVSWAHRGRCQRLPHRPCKDVPHNRKAETPHTHTHTITRAPGRTYLCARGISMHRASARMTHVLVRSLCRSMPKKRGR